ncbi:glycosyltransferase family 2 protein [Flavobacterium akiainvivens]|uniref:glycosyltransferase family 2 protein n=1 Tax=Flavobacterium akiainvivens TaxID=1202724 RepID=UPI0006C8DED1|nr:glycosyltransferase family A protein [Flavobacterium akiainvivens]SFQ62175.1 Glycosyltransferase involved in cell wall bisynthesis [Flavobacterium akiainvivens]
MPLFSVVIPLYNKQEFIAATLQSVLAQTVTDFEVIVVNDVSTDGSMAVACSFTDPRIKIFSHPQNKGLSATRNTGIKHAAGTYIAFLDADDLLDASYLEKINLLIKRFPEAGIFGVNYVESWPGSIQIQHPFNLSTGIVANFYESSLRQPIYAPSGLCVKKEVFEKAGYYDETITFGEDVDFNIRANYYFKLAYWHEPLMTFVHNTGQMTRQGLKGKVVPDFDKYEPLAHNRPDIKRYLDFYRYVFARWYKLEGNTQGYNKMLVNLNPASLNYKQRALLAAPGFVHRLVKKIKNILAKKGVNPTTY